MVEQSYSDLSENLFQDTSIKEQLYDTDATISTRKLLEAAQSTILTQCESNGLGVSSFHLQGVGFGTLAGNKLVDSKGNPAKYYSPQEVISIVSGTHELVHVLISTKTGNVFLVQQGSHKIISLIHLDINKDHQSMEYHFGVCHFQVSTTPASTIVLDDTQIFECGDFLSGLMLQLLGKKDMFYFVRRDWTELTFDDHNNYISDQRNIIGFYNPSLTDVLKKIVGDYNFLTSN